MDPQWERKQQFQVKSFDGKLFKNAFWQIVRFLTGILMWPLLVRGDFKRFRLLSHNTVCNRDRTRSGAVNFSLLNNPMGPFTYAVYGCICCTGAVCNPASWVPTVASHETGWGSRLYLLMGIFTLYSILPRMRMAISHPSLVSFKCLGTVRHQSYDICVKDSPVLYRERSQRETV